MKTHYHNDLSASKIDPVILKSTEESIPNSEKIIDQFVDFYIEEEKKNGPSLKKFYFRWYPTTFPFWRYPSNDTRRKKNKKIKAKPNI